MENKEKTIIVTGGNSGLGYSTACRLCSDGYDVILGCRSKDNAEAAVTQIKKTQPNALVQSLLLDLCDFNSVRDFVQKFQALDRTLYALVNNAGMTMPFTDTNRTTTPDGLEVTMASNYYGHFLLTNLLLEDLKQGAQKFQEARVISVASALHDPESAKGTLRGKQLPITELSLDNMNLDAEGTYNGIQAYKNSKCAVIMFTYELARRLEGTGVSALAVCPGFIPTTNLSRHSGRIAMFFMQYILPTISYLSGKKFVVSLDEGTKRIYHLTTSGDIKGVTGKFYQDGVLEPTQSKGDTLNEDMWKQLWDKTEDFVGLNKN